jgi:hypothetical protein
MAAAPRQRRILSDHALPVDELEQPRRVSPAERGVELSHELDLSHRSSCMFASRTTRFQEFERFWVKPGPKRPMKLLTVNGARYGIFNASEPR